MEKKIQEADARVEALEAELTERERQVEGIRQNCTDLEEATDKEVELLAKLTEKRCQVCSAPQTVPYLLISFCPQAMIAWLSTEL